MSIPITLNGTTYNIPTQGQNPAWGEDLTAFLVALSGVVTNIVGPLDILDTTISITNNQSSAISITGAVFNPTVVRSAIITYSLYRSTSLTDFADAGWIILNYKSLANTWDVSQHGGGDTNVSGVVFSITPSGNLQYTSSNMAGSAYLGKFKYSAKVFSQT